MKNKTMLIALSVVVAILVLGVLYTVFTVNNRDLHEISLKPNPEEIQQNPNDNELWGKYYPRHWESYQKGLQSDTHTKWGGNTKESKLDIFPYLKTLYAGLGYSKEFWEPRGHPYALDDITSVPGERRKTGGACLTCKSPQVPGLIEQFGDKFYNSPFDEMAKNVDKPIGCANCHDPKTNELKVVQPALINAWKRQGKDITKANKQELRSLVCAQCHVTYYFKDVSKETTFPWDEGLKADETYQYYQKLNYSEWEHPIVKTGLVKARHPDYEFFLGSTHHSAGVSCADCHMPYVKEGDSKITSHWWVSPLITIKESCTQCHTQGEDYLRERVYNIQDQHDELMDIGAEAMITATDTIAQALKTPGVDQELLKQSQDRYREAFWHFDYISTANSMGFHNPQEGAKIIGQSIQYANEATRYARESILKAAQ